MDESTVSFIIDVECKGTPREMGRQYGEQAEESIKGNIEFRYLKKGRDIARETQFVEIADRMLSSRMPRIYEEMVGIAEGAKVDLGWILMMNQWESIVPNAAAESKSSSLRCTSMAVKDSPTGPILGKNNDGAPGEHSCWVMRRSEPDEGHATFQLTYAGWVCGLDAMNSAGLATSHNSTGSQFDKSGELIDIRLMIYHALRNCETVEQAWEMLNEEPLTGKGYNIVLVDAQGGTGVVEAAVPELRLRATDAPFAYATNHYALEEFAKADNRKPDAKVITQNRLEYLKQIDQTARPTDIDTLKGLLGTREDWAPCRYGGHHSSETLWSMVAVPRERMMYVSDGPPDANEYKAYSFG